MTQWGSFKNRRFGETYRLNYQGASVDIYINVVPNWLNFSTLMMETIRSCETLVIIRATRHHIPEHGIHPKNTFSIEDLPSILSIPNIGEL
jgi:hypothetical protein